MWRIIGIIPEEQIIDGRLICLTLLSDSRRTIYAQPAPRNRLQTDSGSNTGECESDESTTLTPTIAKIGRVEQKLRQIGLSIWPE